MEYSEAKRILSENQSEDSQHGAEELLRERLAQHADIDNGTFPPQMIAPGVNAAVEEYYQQRDVDPSVRAAFELRFGDLFREIFTEPVIDILTEMRTIKPPPQNSDPKSSS